MIGLLPPRAAPSRSAVDEREKVTGTFCAKHRAPREAWYRRCGPFRQKVPVTFSPSTLRPNFVEERMPEPTTIHLSLNAIDYSILGVYVLFILGIGYALKRFTRTEHRFLPFRPGHSRLDHGPGVHLGQPGRPGNHRHGGLAGPSTACSPAISTGWGPSRPWSSWACS